MHTILFFFLMNTVPYNIPIIVLIMVEVVKNRQRSARINFDAPIAPRK